MSMVQAEQTLQQVLAAYDFGGEVETVERFGEGHINDTFRIEARRPDGSLGRSILQRVSPVAFKEPDKLMENIVNVTEHLSREIKRLGGDPTRETLSVLRTRDGAASVTDSAGGVWRAFPFVEGTVCYQSAETPELFAASGRAFGRFQRLLRDYPAHTLHETIPRFHYT